MGQFSVEKPVLPGSALSGNQQYIPSHAEAFQRVNDVEDGLREERRRLLYAAVKSEFVSVDKFRNGLLSDLAPIQGTLNSSPDSEDRRSSKAQGA